MKICVLTRTTTFHHIGGMEDHIQTLCEGLVKNGVEVDVITTSHPDGLEAVEKNGVRFYFIKDAKAGAYSKAWWEKNPKRFLELHKIRNYDLIHSQSAGGYSIEKPGIPLITSFHGTAYDEEQTRFNVLKYKKGRVSAFDRFIANLDYRRGHQETRALCQKSDLVIATSNEQAVIFRDIYGADQQKVSIVFNGMNLDQFVPGIETKDLRIKYEIKPEDKIILCLARLEPDKGVQFAIEAMSDLVKKDTSIKLLVVGDGSFRKFLEKLAQKNKVSANVIFTGFIPFNDLAKYMNLADIFVNYTIRQNGYDLTMLEAMACQTPVIASNLGSNPTLIREGQSGLLVPLWRTDLLIDTLWKLIENKPLREQIGRSAREMALKEFSDTAMVQKTIEIYKKVSNKINNYSINN